MGRGEARQPAFPLEETPPGASPRGSHLPAPLLPQAGPGALWRPGRPAGRAARALALALALALVLALALALAGEHGGVTAVAPEGRETFAVGLGRRAISPRAYVQLTRRPMGWPTQSLRRPRR